MSARWRKHWRVLVIVCALVAIASLSVLVSFLSPLSQRWAVNALSARYHANVRLKAFHVSAFPGPSVSGEGLELISRDSPAPLPVVTVAHFYVHISWTELIAGLFRRPVRVAYVRLDGLTINVPPHQNAESNRGSNNRHLPPIDFKNISADGTALRFLSSDPKSHPLVFKIAKLRLRSVAVGKPMSFRAVLSNPKPVGQIHTSGSFGPWNPGDPGMTPVSGAYTFGRVHLSSINGLHGTLSSKGAYTGRLSLIEVHGETKTPDFGLNLSKNRIQLKTQFDAVVNGTNGDTLLHPVTAELGESKLTVRGGVFQTTGKQGETVQITAAAKHARIQDLVLLAINGPTPPMVGAADFDTQIWIPQGRRDLAHRMRLEGHFAIRSSRFTDPGVEEKITRLSRRATGHPRQTSGPLAVFNMKGHFVISNAVMSFSALSFEVPGAAVSLHGTYGLANEDLNFKGTLRLQAKLSQTTTGIKSLLLRIVDPLFKGKHAGSVIPIKITGTTAHPSFGIQVGKVLKRIP